ncbi:hypothetical protein N7536_001564 [Penicillium majusculum]|uniref:Phytanoyl-CoA dioxygenase family protein n=1 Tax=Penicillium solitum TaxID=60172 RepID=A0A1V6Q4K7_9EURO|nr:uncharacterized protein PENSOL_c129G09500 [Penicillium solitum]KAJ5705875.1 hypothetical protein N7536_001564 [Penicillium majusculum]OQD84185.1 hypothetical protein PENSOL_c129G09500 [Penicillium solitum]
MTVEPKLSVPVVKATASVDEIVAALKLAGGVIIRNAVGQATLDQIEVDVRPGLEQDTAWSGSFFPSQTRRTCAALQKSPTYAHEIVMHPLFQGASNRMLTEKQWFWSGNEKQWTVSRPQLSNTIVFSIGPGASAQPLHRDDSIHQRYAHFAEVYPSGREGNQRDSSIGFFVAGKKATKANGATRFIPGSHLWDQNAPPNEDLCEFAEMERGDAFMMLASCFHGGSANNTTDEERLIFSTFMTKGYLRQEENMYLSVDMDVMRKYPVDIQKIAGYSLSEPFLGWVDSTDPRKLLDPNIPDNTDMWTGAKEPADPWI